jgi:branched-chain amino acid transport system substrate-binding protein
VSQPGFAPNSLSAAANKQFIKPFEATYGHRPATEAIFGYEAMAAVLAVLREAGPQAGDRTTVVHDFYTLKRPGSVLGSYSIDSNGDPTIAPFVFRRYGTPKLVQP